MIQEATRFLTWVLLVICGAAALHFVLRELLGWIVVKVWDWRRRARK